jgi:septal ring factor EnvC (AmiA/AmiB activator)
LITPWEHVRNLKRFIRTTVVVAALFALGAAPIAAAPTASSKEAKAKQAELERLRRTIQQLSNNLGTLRSQHRDERTKLHSLNKKIARLNHSLEGLEEKRRRLADNLAKLQKQKQAGKHRLAQQQRRLSQLLRAAYLLGQQSPLKILLNATEPATLERSLRYYDYFYRSRVERIADINNTLANLNNLEQGIQARQHELDSLAGKRRAQRQKLQHSRRERSQLLAELNHDIQDTEQRLAQLKEDAQSLQELVKRLGRALAKIPAPPKLTKFARLKGRLPLPARGTVSARFGSSRHVGKLKWQGIVIDAADGTDVKAIAAGRVVFADWLRGFGLLLILDHGDGYMSLYGYNQDLRKSVGDMVNAGDVIATVGDNGGHNQSGLYFEIRHQGAPVNPLNWCRTR